MFTVNLYSFSKKENSTKQPTSSPSSFSCMLKDNSGVVNPTIVLDLGLNASPSQYNYAYIAEFNRYYWITEWTNEHPLWVASLSVDVLASYKSEIGLSDLYVLRASNEYDGAVIDTMYPTKTNASVKVDTFNTIYDANVETFIEDGMFIIGVVAKGGTYGSIQYYCVPPVYMRRICNQLLNNNFLSAGDDGLSLNDASITLQKSLIDPLSYIKSAIYLPFTLIGSGGTTQHDIDIWSWTVDDVVVYKLGKNDLSVSKSVTMPIRKHPQTNGRGNYVNTSPYTSIEISLPPFNIVNVDTLVSQAGGNVVCNVRVDKPTGLGVMECYIGDALVARETCQIGVPIQLSQVTKDYVGALQSAISGVGGALDVASGKLSGAAAYANGFIGSAVALYKPIQSSTGSMGALSLFIYPPKMITKFQLAVDDDLASHGRPLCKIRKPSNLGGYMMIQDADVSIAGTDFELSKVRSYLEGGFYYE